MSDQLSILNPHPRRLPGPSLLHELVSGPSSGHAVAIEHLTKDAHREKLSYAQLQRRSNALAHQISSVYEASKPTQDARFIVPLFIPQSLELYVAQLAVLKAGGAFCPIALDAPEERLRYIMQDVDAKILLTVATLETSLPSLSDVSVFCIDGKTSEGAEVPPTPAVTPSDAAYVMYTSGSTGTPKGVIISHNSATQALLAHDQHIPRFSRFLQFANPTFDVSVFEIFFPFYRGSTLVSCDRRRLLNDLPGIISTMEIDAAELTPSVASSLLHDRASVPSLQVLLTIGEMLKQSVVDEFASSTTSEGILHGMYGPTEATIHCTLQPRFTDKMAVNNIGIPLDTVSAFVVNPSPNSVGAVPEIVPLGEEGELAVGGYQLADGYLNRDDQTRAAFVDHPQYGRLYRTGDRARLTSAGTMECLGRISGGQVKLRGQRIELGEVEYAVSRTDGCKTAAADIVEGALVAFCVRSTSSLDVEEVRRTSAKWLPAFMVPNDIVVLDRLPYLASGKIDRRALSDHYHSLKRSRAATNEAETIEPQSKTASKITEVLSHVLGRELNARADLQNAGLDSLSAIRVASQLHRSGFARPDATKILEARSVLDLEQLLSPEQDTSASPAEGEPVQMNCSQVIEELTRTYPLIANHSSEVEEVYGATAVQSAMLIETAKAPQRYCNSILLDIPVCEDLDRVQAAFHALARRHPLLRSGFLTSSAPRSGHLVVTWNSLLSRQIYEVDDDFNFDFSLNSDEDFLRPCYLQFRRGQNGREVLLKIHHALYDQWSIDILKTDLATALRGEPLEDATAFRQIAAFHDMHSEASRSEEALSFWQQHLNDFTSTPIPPMRGHCVSPGLERTEWQPLSFDILHARQTAASLGYSLPAVFQTAYAYLLSLYTGSTDVTFGTVFSGRHIAVPGVERTFGPLLSTLPSRLDLTTVSSCLDLLRLTQDRNRAMQRHSSTPLVDIKKAVDSAPGSALFDSLFVWQETSLGVNDMNSSVTEAASADQHEYNLVIEFEPSAQGLRARATYQKSILPVDQVDLALRQLECIGKHLLEHPQDPLDTLATAFRPDLLSAANPQPTKAAASHELLVKIEQQVDSTPEQVAIEFAGNTDGEHISTSTISYAELNRRANSCARSLLSSGVTTGGMVCVCMEKSIELYIAILAVIKSGAGYLPLLPETPSARVQAILRQASVQACVGDGTSLEMLQGTSSAPVLPFPQLDGRAADDDNVGIYPDDSELAYMVFTSGSTGEPKGVCVTRANLAGNLAVLAELYAAGPGDRLLQACSQAFDVSVFEIFFAFSTGMTLCAAVKDTLFTDLERSIRAFNVTHLSLTPTVAALLEPQNVPSVKFLVTAGEGVTDTVRRKWAGHGLHQGYGPSETTNICSVNMAMKHDDPLGNVGRPFKNTSALVLSTGSDCVVLPSGALGEFAFGGEQVFPGYLGRDDLNAEKLLDHPEYGRIYRSGDLGRVLHDGTLLISGRLDDQVKLRGNRIELGEINAAMIRHQEVSDCATLLVEDGHMNQMLVAYWVPKRLLKKKESATRIVSSGDDSIPGLFQHLEALLPSYMIPAMLLPISKIPFTVQTKLDRRLLRTIVREIPDESRFKYSNKTTDIDDDSDWSDEETTIALALAQSLHIPRNRIRRTTPFFALGMNSLTAIAFAKELSRQNYRQVSIAQVLQHASVKRLSQALHVSTSTEPQRADRGVLNLFSEDMVKQHIAACEAEGLQVEKVLPCTPLQEAMLSASMSSRSSSYQNLTSFRVFGDATQLLQCWETLVERHAILRTRFAETDSAAHPFMQLVMKRLPMPLRQIPTASDYTPATQQLAGDQEPHLDLSRPFLMDMEYSEGQTYMSLRMHHALYDGMSMSILLEEAERLFGGHSLPKAPSSEPFLKEVLYQNMPQAMQYWSGYLREYQPKPFPAPSDSRQPTQCTVEETLSISSQQLELAATRQSTTSSILIQAAWTKVLACLQDSQDVCFGNVVSGRAVLVPEVETLVAPCFNTVPIRVDLTRCRTNSQLAQVLHQHNLEIQEHQLSALRRMQSLSADPSLHLFDSILLVQPPSKALDSTIWEMLEDVGTMDMPVVLEVTPDSDVLKITLHHTAPQVSMELATLVTKAFVSALLASIRYTSGELRFLPDFDPTALVGQLASSQVMNGVEKQADNLDETDWTAAEVKVREVFAALSKVSVERIAKTTSMYQLGLDSLNAAQVASRLRRLGLNVDAMDVAEKLTPAAIAKAATGDEGGQAEPSTQVDLRAFDEAHRARLTELLGLNTENVEAVLPCTALQCGMIAQSLQSHGGLYINHVTYSIPSGLVLDQICHAWKAALKKHQALRVGFTQLEDPQRPFAMILHSSGDVSKILKCYNHQVDLQTVEDTATAEIIANLHLPAWRLSIATSGASSTMTLSLHHALYDAESLQHVVQDFHRALSGTLLGTASISKTLTSILLAEQNQAQDPADFWQKRLETMNPSRFPDLNPNRTHDCHMHVSTRHSALTVVQLERYCKSTGTTIQAVGQAAWASLLSAYTGEPNVTFGTVFSARSGSQSEATAFPAISTVPIHCNVGEPLDDLGTDMVAYNASIYRFRFTPLADVQRYCGFAGQSLFDTVFVYQKGAAGAESKPDWPIVRETAAVDYAASLELEVSAQGTVTVRLTAHSQYMPQQQADLIARQYEHTLVQWVQQLQYDSFESTNLYSVSPAKEDSLPSSASLLHQFVENGAQTSPDKPALEFITALNDTKSHSKTWTYRQLDERANQVAHLLQENDVSAGSIVAVRMQKRAEASFAFIGILKAGCAFLALDPELPQARQEFILQDAGVKVLLHDGKPSDSSPATHVAAVSLHESELSTYATTAIEIPEIRPSATCYVLYTSGTTGTPKGCEITHENAVQAMLAFQRLFAGHWNESSRWLQFASYWFDVSILEQFWSWSVEIAVVGAPRDLVLDDLSGFIEAARITHIDLTPSLARLLHPDEVPSLHKGVFITGGEALKQEIIDAWGPNSVVCNGYGPTEATIGVTMKTFVDSDAKPSNIGPPFDNVGAYVLTPGTSQPVLRGAVGELCVSGKLVGKGYLNRPELTAKSFPYLESLQERMYRTGDLVRLLADGSISFLGRIDTQAKLRGQRLEIGEIDSVITASSDNIVDVVSLVHKDAKAGKEALVSFITIARTDRRVELAVDIQDEALERVSAADDACRNRLPGYMVPTHIIPITSLPLTVNNKVDTKRLVALLNGLTPQELQRLKGSQESTSELNSSERRIAEILCKLLSIDVEAVDRNSNLFSLGLSSVSAITLSSLLRKEGLRSASVVAIMKNPVLWQLSGALLSEKIDDGIGHTKQAQLSIKAFAQRHRNYVLRRLSTTTDDLEAITPCTPLQEGLIIESMRHPERPYFNEFEYRLANVEPRRLEKAFLLLVGGIEILRAKYLQTDDGFAQVILRQGSAKIEKVELGDETKETAMARLKSQWLVTNQTDLVEPLKVFVLCSGQSEILVFFAHHAVYDGISWELMLDRLAETYKKQGPVDCGPSFTSILPSGPLRSLPEGKSFWQKRLGDVEFRPMPRKAESSDTPPSVSKTTVQSTKALDDLRRQLGVSHQAVLQVCFEAALVHHFNHISTYGHVVSGRSVGVDGADRVIGPLFNTLPTSIDVDASDNWAAAIRRIHDRNTAAVTFQHTPLREIKKWCCSHPADSMFDVLFVFQHRGEHGLAEKEDLWHAVDSPLKADYPLAFEITLLPGQSFQIMTVAQSNVADQGRLDALLATFRQALHAAGQRPEHLITEAFSIPRSAERATETRKTDDQPDVNGVYDFEWTGDALILRDAIAQICGVDAQDVDEHSTIFTLGLDSIDAVKLASRAKRAGLSLPVSKILQAQTIPRMLQAAGNAQVTRHDEHEHGRLTSLETKLKRHFTEVGRDTRLIERVLPATPHQEALVAEMLRSDYDDYYNHDVLRLQPGTDSDKLRQALQTVIERTLILRTAFVEVTDPSIDVTFAQLVHQPGEVDVQERSLNNEDELQALLRQIKDEARSTLGSRPPTAVTFVCVGDVQFLIFSLAHAQYDGHSLALIHDDVRRAYDGEYQERPTYEPVIQKSLAATSEEARNFWSDALCGANTSRFPPGHADSDQAIVHRAERPSNIPTAVARSFCQSYGVSIQALAQTAWSLLLAHYTRSLEVIYGVVLACRESEDAEQILFPTMNTVPVRATLHGSRAEMLRYMQSNINDIRPWQRTPLRVIQAACSSGVKRGQDRGGLFDTLFVYQHRPTAEGEEAKPLYESVGGSSSVEYPVAVEMEAVKDELILRTACKGSAMNEHQTSELLNQLDKVLSDLVNATDAPTVYFSGLEVTICGLQSFRLSSDGAISETEASAADQFESAADELPPVASQIREVLAQVAKVPAESISPSVSIENLGIDSISAIKVTALLRRQGVKMSVSEIVKEKTVAKMAQALSSREAETGSPEQAQDSGAVVTTVLRERGLDSLPADGAMDKDNIEAILPATAGQVYMLNVWHNSAGQLFYPTFEYELDLAADIEMLREAWKQLVARHSILRTVFCATNDEAIPVLQVVLQEAQAAFHETDQSQVATSQGQPMVSLTVTRKNDNTYHLGLKIHHALYDAISLPLLLQDFHRLISGHQTQPPDLKHADFLALSLPRETQKARQAFWTTYLQDLRPLHLPQPKQRSIPQKRIEIFQPSLFASIVELEKVARSEGLAIQALIFAAYARLYAALASKDCQEQSHEPDVVLGIYLANRTHLPSLEHLAAPTLNLVPLAVRSPARTPLLDLAKQVQKDLQSISTMHNSSIGLWEVEKWSGVKIDTFVNFFKLPGGDEDEQAEKRDVAAEPKLRELDTRRTTSPYSRIAEPSSSTENILPRELAPLRSMSEVYQRSVDLEATISPTTGSLDVGIFCPEAMLGLEEAEGVLRGLRGLLEGLLRGTRSE